MFSEANFTAQEEFYSGPDSTITRGYENESGTKVVIKQATANGTQVEREISMLQKLQCPGIIRVLSSDSDKGIVVLEYAEGGDLLTRLLDSPISEELVKKTVYQILNALVYIHGMGIIHNDIKPDNILISDLDYRGDNVILSDFGLACDTDESGLAREYRGTFEYAPPEKLRGVPYGPAADIWSLGVTMFACLLQQMPYRDQNSAIREIVAGLPLLQTDIMNSLSEDARDLLRQMLQKDPHARISASDALNHPWFSDIEDGKL